MTNNVKPLSILLLTFTLTTGLSQTNEPTKTNASVSLGGQLMISGNTKDLFYNMGGGGISMQFTDAAISINFLPSLRYHFETHIVSPVLGFGPQLKLKERFLIGIPFYYNDNAWTASIGVGYKFRNVCAQ